MTARQRILTIIYPLWMFFMKLTGKRSSIYRNKANMKPPVSFYDLSATLNNGSQLDFSELQGKKVLIVNTASDCGYTNQYEDLQKLYEQYQDKIVVIGFPANDFKEQEKGDDEEIAAFCKLNFGVTFPLAKKSFVIGTDKNEVFSWLSDKNKNGWNEQEPVWNFCKYLVSEEGILMQYFDPGISPTGNEIMKLLNDKS